VRTPMPSSANHLLHAGTIPATVGMMPATETKGDLQGISSLWYVSP
jgi:hypothetical protein